MRSATLLQRAHRAAPRARRFVTGVRIAPKARRALRAAAHGLDALEIDPVHRVREPNDPRRLWP